MSSNNKFRAGAGKAYMNFPEEAFPTAREDYVGIHDLPHARILILEDVERYVILNLEIVNIFPDTREKLMTILYEETGVKPENIWYHNCHVLSTPHAWKIDLSSMGNGPGPGGPPGAKGPKGPGGAPGANSPMKKRTPQQQRSVELVSETICNAVREAAVAAAKNLQDAKVGSGKGFCLGNVNRNLETDAGWWVSCNDEGAADHVVPVLRIDDMSDEPIAILFGFHAQPAVLDMLFLKEGGRLVSGDIAGYSTEFIESEFPDAVAMYFTGAGGDGSPYFRGDYYLRGRNGRRIDKSIHEKAYLLAEMLGERIGQQVILATERIQTKEPDQPVEIIETTCVLPAQKPGRRPEGPTREGSFEPDGTKEIPLSAMRIGDMGMLGLLPEIGQSSAIYIRENSPFETTLVSTFTNSGPTESGIGKYLGETDYYDKVTFQALNSMFAKGAAEEMQKEAVELLKELKNA